MVDSESKLEFSEKPMSSLLFNRSLTMYSSSTDSSQKQGYLHHPIDRFNSLSKFYNSKDPVGSTSNSIKGKVKKLCSIFETRKLSGESHSQSASKLRSTKSIGGSELRLSLPTLGTNSSIHLQGTEDSIVMYLTSLRGVRRTYEDCYAVRMIFRGFRVWVDERDVSMDSAYKKEIQSVLGEKNVRLPQVFIRGKYVGGAETMKQLFETGELIKILEGFPIREPGYVCESCGDVRFLPCGNCSGSRKVFSEDEGLLKRCLDCNENGLIRCPNCGS